MTDRGEIGPLAFDFCWSMHSGAWLVKRGRWWGRASDDEINRILAWINNAHGLGSPHCTHSLAPSGRCASCGAPT